MSANRWIRLATAAVVLAVVAIAAYTSRDSWLPYFTAGHADDEPALPGMENKILQAKLSPEARSNLQLVSKPVPPQNYWRSIEIPGTIADRPGVSDRTVPAPVTGIVAKIHHFPGDLVRAGQPLFTLRITSDSMLLSQTELVKNATEKAIADAEHKRYSDPDLKKLNLARFIELEYQRQRVSAAVSAHRQDLQARGLTREQVDDIAGGKFVTEVLVTVPAEVERLAGIPAGKETGPQVVEVQELKVELGQQVQAGQTLCYLANHRWLYIEGHTFKREAPWLEKAAKNGWPILVEFAEDEAQNWPPLAESYTIRHLSNTVDPESRTLTFFVPLTNQSRTYEKDGRTLLVWRFRPGQRVHMRVPVEHFKDVLVLPVGAVVREGPEAFVFRQNGDLFERRAVHLLHEDRVQVVIANDGAIQPKNDYIAQGSAATLQRVLKAQHAASGLPPGAHFHADGSLHIPGK